MKQLTYILIMHCMMCTTFQKGDGCWGGGGYSNDASSAKKSGFQIGQTVWIHKEIRPTFIAKSSEQLIGFDCMGLPYHRPCKNIKESIMALYFTVRT